MREFHPPCVLVITRERGLVQLLRLAFSPAGMKVRDVPGVNEAAGAIAALDPAVLVVHSQALAPDYVSGELDWLRTSRGRRIPLLLLVAEGMERAALWSFDVDDYVILPADAAAIASRAHNLMRQSRPAEGVPHSFELDSVCLDFAGRRCKVGKRQVRLSQPEWRLLEVLALAEGQRVESEELLRGVWGPGFEQDREMLGVWVERIRRAIEHNPAKPRVILGDAAAGFALGCRPAAGKD